MLSHLLGTAVTAVGAEDLELWAQYLHQAHVIRLFLLNFAAPLPIVAPIRRPISSLLAVGYSLATVAGHSVSPLFGPLPSTRGWLADGRRSQLGPSLEPL